MKKQVLFFVFLGFTSIFLGQIHAVGISLGGTNYVGDVGSDVYFYPRNIGGSVFYKYNENPRIVWRITYSFLPISGDDAEALTTYRSNRNYRFENTINELAFGLEYNFFEYDLSSEDTTWTPYFLVELAGFNYTNVKSYSEEDLPIKGNKTSFAIPFGLGFKSKLSSTLVLAFETKFRYTFEDDLDFTTRETPNIILEGTGNDWYLFTGFSVIYTFGRRVCYADGL